MSLNKNTKSYDQLKIHNDVGFDNRMHIYGN